MVAKTLWAAVQGDPTAMMHVHKWATLGWFAASFPVMAWWALPGPGGRFLTFVSLYAVVSGHWAAWQAARVEVNQVDGNQ